MFARCPGEFINAVWARSTVGAPARFSLPCGILYPYSSSYQRRAVGRGLVGKIIQFNHIVAFKAGQFNQFHIHLQGGRPAFLFQSSTKQAFSFRFHSALQPVQVQVAVPVGRRFRCGSGSRAGSGAGKRITIYFRHGMDFSSRRPAGVQKTPPMLQTVSVFN